MRKYGVWAVWSVGLSLFVYLAASWISFYTPIAGDSFMHDRTGYMGEFAWHKVWTACVHSYLYWNPRLGEMVAYTVTSAPLWVWILFNPICVMVFMLGIYVLAIGKLPNIRDCTDSISWIFTVGLFIAAGVTIYYICLTRPGAMNYLWTGCAIVWFMNIYRTQCNWRRCAILCLPAGMLCGACNEGASVGMLLVITALMIRQKWRREPVSPMLWWGGVGLVLGTLFLFAAPGNYARLATDNAAIESAQESNITVYIHAIGQLLYLHVRLLCKLYAVLLVLLCLLVCRGKRFVVRFWNLERNNLLYIAALLILGVLISVCYFPVCVPAHHTQFVSSWPAMAAIVLLFHLMYKHGVFTGWLTWLSVSLSVLAVIYGLMFCMEYYHAGRAAFERETLLHAAVQHGNAHPVVPSIVPLFFENKLNGTDINSNWGGDDMLRRFGIKSLRVKPPVTKPKYSFH